MSDQQKHNERAGEDSPALSNSERGAPIISLTIWPHRSLSRKGFRNVILLTAVGLAIPIVPLLGSPVGWALLPFGLGTVGLLTFFFLWNYRDGRLTEVLNLWPDRIEVIRTEPNGKILRWEANPYWVKVTLRTDGPVENYLTLKGNDREIELGAYLSPDERVELRNAIEDALRKVPRP